MNNHNYLFPSLVSTYSDIITEEENDALYDAIINDNSEGKGSETWASGSNSPNNSFGTHFLIENDTCRAFTKKICQFISDYQNEMYNSDHDIKLVGAWYNVYTGVQYQESHHHLPSKLSVIYYVRVPEGSSPLLFANPLTIPSYPNVKETTSYTAQGIDCHFNGRDMIVFPSYLRHFVPPGTNKEPRVSIAMNFE